MSFYNETDEFLPTEDVVQFSFYDLYLILSLEPLVKGLRILFRDISLFPGNGYSGLSGWSHKYNRLQKSPKKG